MRIAFVGLSTPLFYDYKRQATRTPSDTTSSPNPILDSPFGLLLLFDEVWFLCRSLCPENMRKLPYVKFLDESGMLPSLDGIESSHKFYESIEKDDPELFKRYLRFCDNVDSAYKENIKKIKIYWDAAHDNHSHALKIGNIYISANSFALERLFFDMEIVKRIGRKDVELITNSFSQSWLENPDNPIMRAKLAEFLTIENIPNYLSPSGPYHPCVEEARENNFLKDFRKWIATHPISTDEKELLDIKREIEEAIQKSQDEIFLKYLDPKTQYVSVGKTIVGAAADLVIPGVSTVATITEEILGYFDKGKRRWQGFIVSLKYLKTKS